VPLRVEFHSSPLSPIAAAKAIWFSIWEVQETGLVPRVWKLQQDKLVDSIDVRQVVLITHKWIEPGKETEASDGEIVYSHVTIKKVVEPLASAQNRRSSKTSVTFCLTNVQICLDGHQLYR
jgi:hypothetical protein